jgi:hypothetical protein
MQVTATVLDSKPDDVFTLSVSKSKTFDQCKAKYRFCYIEKLPRKDWDFHIFGKWLHDVLERFHKRFLGKTVVYGAEVVNALHECWGEALKEWRGELTEDQIRDGKIIIFDQYDSLLKEEGGLDNIISVEQSFYINIDGKVLLNGFIDRVQVDSDGVVHVMDYKTTKDRRYLKDFFQLETYAYALMLEDPALQRVRASFSLLRHGFDLITQEYRREDIVEPIQNKFLKYAGEIAEERIFRASPQFLCKYCDFQSECNEGKAYLIKRGMLEVASDDYGLIAW